MRNLWKGLYSIIITLLLCCMIFITDKNSIKITDIEIWKSLDYQWVPYLFYATLGVSVLSTTIKLALSKSRKRNADALVYFSSYITFIFLISLISSLALVWNLTKVSQLTNVLFPFISVVCLGIIGLIINNAGSKTRRAPINKTKKVKNQPKNEEVDVNQYNVKDIDDEVSKPSYIEDPIYTDIEQQVNKVVNNNLDNFTSTPDENDENLQLKIRNMQHIVSTKAKDINWDDISALGNGKHGSGKDDAIKGNVSGVVQQEDDNFQDFNDNNIVEADSFDSLNLESIDEEALQKDMGDSTNSMAMSSWQAQNKKMVEEVTRLYNEINDGSDDKNYINTDKTYEMKIPKGVTLNEDYNEGDEYQSNSNYDEEKIGVEDLYNMPYEKKDPSSQTIIPRRLGSKVVRYTKSSFDNAQNNLNRGERRRAIYSEAKAKKYKESYNMEESDFIWDAIKKRNRDILNKPDDNYFVANTKTESQINNQVSDIPEPIIDIQNNDNDNSATFNIVENKPFGDYYSETISIQDDASTIPDPIIESKDKTNSSSEPTIDWNL
ncbi:hypothetical protein [Spiroplasma endosymbiont of Aspidapion aeneum]|uniref:hypothetical protein n=1 Tax=Spiroplasma endosymbiont of Aspidapion aeneum TaxID=3066276 RepID=UPI00313E24F7